MGMEVDRPPPASEERGSNGRSPRRSFSPPFPRPPASDRMAVVKIRFELPRELAMSSFSRAHPEAVVRLMRFQPLPGHRMLGEYEYAGPFGPDVLEEIRRLSDVTSVAPLASTDSFSRGQLVTEEPAWLALESELRVLYRHPIVLQDGEVTLEVAAPVSRLERLLASLRQMMPVVRLLMFGRDPLLTCPPTLTPRQRTLLLQALAAGYFDVPRRITLTRFATRLHRSKSALSQALAQVERRLAEASATPHI